MRIKNTLVNLIYIWGSALLIFILNLITRRIFLDVLVIDYLGYDGLFTSIFSFLTLSEMGITEIITYHMYSEIAGGNKEQICKLLYMYKTIYRLVGIFVLVAGSAVSLFLPLILKNQVDDWGFIYLIYYLQLAVTLCTYFLAYRRVLFVTHQQIYVCTAVDTVMTIISTCAKMAVLVFWQNYIAYLVVGILNHVISNGIISRLSHVRYPEFSKVKVKKEDFQKLNLWHDVKNMMATKIAGTIYGSSDSIIISSMLGVGMVGMVENYRTISAKLQEFIISIFRALQGSIGNLVYADKEKKGISFFYALDLLGFYMGLVVATGLTVVGQDFILFWLKKSEMQLPDVFLAVLSLNVFVSICNNPMNYFRNTLGHFESDRNYMIAAAAVNVLLSILLAGSMGITGVMVGTVAGHLLIYMGRTVVVYKHYVKKAPIGYYLQFLLRIALFAAAVFLSAFCTRTVSGGIVGILIKGVVSVLASTVVFAAYGLTRKEFKTILEYVKIVFRMVTDRTKQEK